MSTPVEDEEWKLERPEPEQYEWEAASADSSDDSDAVPQDESIVVAEPVAATQNQTDAAAWQDATPPIEQDDITSDDRFPEHEQRDNDTVRSWELSEEAEQAAVLDSASDASYTSWSYAESQAPSAASLMVQPATEPSDVQTDETVPQDEPDRGIVTNYPHLSAVEEEDENVSEASFHINPGAEDRFIIEPSIPPRSTAEFTTNRITRMDMRQPIRSGRYGADALVDERKQSHLNDLPSLRAQLQMQGPMAERLRNIAAHEVAKSRRTGKHTPAAHRNAIGESEWWDCLLESLGVHARST